jgi:hypothetical protein
VCDRARNARVRVSTREATVLDLVRHQNAIGGLDAVARITRDLLPQMRHEGAGGAPTQPTRVLPTPCVKRSRGRARIARPNKRRAVKPPCQTAERLTASTWDSSTRSTLPLGRARVGKRTPTPPSKALRSLPPLDSTSTPPRLLRAKLIAGYRALSFVRNEPAV